MIRRISLVAGTIFTEAVRRREIYVIVIVTIAMLVLAATVRFFDLRELVKFYTEISLKTMSVATMLTVIVLAARQLPREFERRTIYPLLAKPLSRAEFVIGKYLGVVAAGVFCFALFMGVFLIGRIVGDYPIAWLPFIQYIYLQSCLVALLAALAFVLSMVMNFDSTVTVAVLIYMLGQALTNALVLLYGYSTAPGQAVLLFLNYTIPQPALFDVSARLVHNWPPVTTRAMAMVTRYALMFIIPYLAISYLLMRRRPL